MTREIHSGLQSSPMCPTCTILDAIDAIRANDEKASILATFEGRCACGFEPSTPDHDKQHSIWDMDRRR